MTEHERTELIDGLRMTAKYLANEGKTAAIYCVRAAAALAQPAQPEGWRPRQITAYDVGLNDAGKPSAKLTFTDDESGKDAARSLLIAAMATPAPTDTGRG